MTASSTASAESVTGDRMAPVGEGLDRAIRRVDEAVMTIRSGDSQSYIDCWADDPDVTLFGAWGPIERGHQALTSTFRWVGSRFTGHSGGTVENTVVHASGDLAYTVGFERGPVSVDGRPEQEMVIRVTHIYRRFGDEWMLVHRHADFPPADQRRACPGKCVAGGDRVPQDRVMEDMLGRLLPRIGGIETVERLAALSGSDFTSVMLEVIRRRADRETPASVLRRYERDRFVRPGQVPARAIRRAEDVLLGGLPEDVEVVQLAPLAPLGTHSALGPVSQDKVVGTIRSSEVAADPTNALALEAASRRARARDTTERLTPVRLAAVQRVVRAAQLPDAPGFFAHFGLFGLVTAGRDTGSLRFEQAALAGQLEIAIRGVALAGEIAPEDVRVALTPLSDGGERIAAAVPAGLGSADVVTDRERQAGRGYYRDLCFKVHAHVNGELMEIGDGGFTDWTARLTANAKERLLILGLATDRLAAFAVPGDGG